jgi:hypothetical protein
MTLIVKPYGPVVERCLGEPPVETTVPSGEVIEFTNYSAFLAPPPEAGRDLSCISIHRASDGLLVFQLNAISNDQWRRTEGRHRFDVKFTLVVEESDLILDGLLNSCVQMVGKVTDATDSSAIEGASVWLSQRYPDHDRHAVTSEHGDWALVFSDTVPAGPVRVGAVGFVPSGFCSPGDLEDLGGGVHRCDTQLSPVTEQLSNLPLLQTAPPCGEEE